MEKLKSSSFVMELTTHTSIKVVTTRLSSKEVGVHLEKNHNSSGDHLIVLSDDDKAEFLDELHVLLRKYLI